MLGLLQTLLDDLILEAGHASSLSRYGCGLRIIAYVSNQSTHYLDLIPEYYFTLFLSCASTLAPLRAYKSCSPVRSIVQPIYASIHPSIPFIVLLTYLLIGLLALFFLFWLSAQLLAIDRTHPVLPFFCTCGLW